MRLIDANALKREITGWQEDIHNNEYDAIKYDFVFDRIIDIVDEATTIDAKFIEHSKWVEQVDGTHYCPRCGYDAKYDYKGNEVLTSYCQKCGTFLDGVFGEEN